MLCIEHDWDGPQFEDISGCGPGSWEAALALHSLNDVPEVAFVTVRLCVVTSFHFMQTPDPDWIRQWDIASNFSVQLCFLILKTVDMVFQNSK